jgi:hypothetical protein
MTNKVTQTKLATKRDNSSYTSKKIQEQQHKQGIYEGKYKLVLHEGKPPRRVDNVDTVIFSRGSLGCHQATSPLCRLTLRGLAANRYPQPSSPKERRKNPPSSVVAQ